ncbi:Fic family protein [uncultured Cytophaga sp.]|uniref:Fic family protein n=1 Tax=uncultured Cytophaga sp. TaxID=160238 RepID=UPI002603A72F|nr:Fic family protein [uncultured Cytophaga sp.]
MKKLESAPAWYNDEFYYEAIKLRKELKLDDIIQKINEEYYYWDKVKYQKNEFDISPELLWTIVKLSRVVNAKKIKFGEYTFQYNISNKIQKALHEFDLNIGGTLVTQGVIPEEDKKRYLTSSIMEEAIASSQIEGAVTTRKKAKEMLRKNAKPKTKSEQMIVNNYTTIKHIVSLKNEPLTERRLFEIHKLITKDTLDDITDEGCYRDNNDVNVVDVMDGETIYTPPVHDKLPDLMKDLFHFFNTTEKDTFIHPIIKAAVIHFMIGFIHPFVDGNGRTARALFYWYLLRNGYWLTEYLSISRLIVKSKTQYAQAYLYSEIDGNDITYFIDYKIKTMDLAFQDLRKYIQRKINEKKQLINFQKLKGVNERQAIILKWIYDEPDSIFSVKEIEVRFNVSNQTARADLLALVEMKYLDIIEQNKKTKVYSKSEKFDMLTDGHTPKNL